MLVAVGVSSVEVSIEGITYEILTPAYLIESLRAGEPVKLFTMQYLEGVGQGSSFVPRLIGFATREHRRLFELLTTVKGLGPKRALRAMVIEPEQIARSIAERDTRALIRLPEVGKKLAETIVLELSEKVGSLLSEVERAGLSRASVEYKGLGTRLSPEAREAVAGLVALGETQADALRIVERVMSDPEGAVETEAKGILARALRGRETPVR